MRLPGIAGAGGSAHCLLGWCVYHLTRPATGKENLMIRTILSFVVLGIVAAGVVGCHASASVDPHGSTSVVPAR